MKIFCLFCNFFPKNEQFFQNELLLTLNRMELTKNKKSYLLGEENRLFDLYPVLRT